MQGTSMYHLHSEMVHIVCRGEVSTCVEVKVSTCVEVCVEVKCVHVGRGEVCPRV